MSVSGIADLHCHPLANLAFGGRFLWGKPGPSDAEPNLTIDQALSPCDPIHNPDGTLNFNPKLSVGSVGDELGKIIGSYLETSVEHVQGNLFQHSHNGNPAFDGWPKYSSVIHQQMHVAWIERAHNLGKLNLIVAAVVNSEGIANLIGDPARSDTFDDAGSTRAQLDAIKDLVRHTSFMEIAYTPQDARQIINKGKVAVILSVEVDTINDFWYEPTDDEIRTFLDNLYSYGVRHVIPIHLEDNVFGGTAIYDDRFNIMNRILRGHYFEVESVPPTSAEGVTFQLSNVQPNENAGVSLVADVVNITKGHLKYSQSNDMISKQRMYHAPLRPGAGWCVGEMVSE